MPERGGYSPLPEPEEIFRGIERELGIPTNQEPDWNVAPTKEHLFESEAPSYYQRQLAADVLHNFYFFQSRPPGEPGTMGEESATVEDLVETFDSVCEERRAEWNDPDPFPGIALEHVLSATRRQIARLEEQKQFEECHRYDSSIQEYYSIHSLIEQALTQGTQGVVGRTTSVRNTPVPHEPTIEQDSGERRVETLVTTIENDIRIASPHLGDRFPFFLPSPTHKLLQGEADTELARALAFLCSDAMLRLVNENRRLAQRKPAAQCQSLSEAEIRGYFQQYLQDEPVSYTLENVLAATKRRLLSRHLGRERRLNVVDRELYRDTILVYGFLSKAVDLQEPPEQP